MIREFLTEQRLFMQSSVPVWTWQVWRSKPLLTCNLLKQPHGFFTRHFYPDSPEVLVQALVASSTAPVPAYRVKQVHSGDVMCPREIVDAVALGLPLLKNGQKSPFPLADGIVSDRAQQSVWACSADCTPALIEDAVTGRVAAVHAGWRGSAQKILPTAISRLQAQGSQLKDLRIALGPAIDGCVYQVGVDVASEIGLTVASSPLAPEALIETLLAQKNPPLLPDDQLGRVRLDVRRINQMQLEQLGLDPAQIAIAPHCTYQDPDNFFSYRRRPEKKVQWSGIVSG